MTNKALQSELLQCLSILEGVTDGEEDSAVAMDPKIHSDHSGELQVVAPPEGSPAHNPAGKDLSHSLLM